MSDILDAILDDTPAEELRLFDLCDEVSGRIADALAAKGWTQRQLADALGKRESYVSRALAGGVNFTLRTIAQFETALGQEIVHTGEVSRNETTAPYAGPTFLHLPGASLRLVARPKRSAPQRRPLSLTSGQPVELEDVPALAA